jgi:2-oxoisovalerate dehydrogenase E1 component beta subunit
MAIKTNIEALRDTMAAALRHDSNVVIIGEDVGPRGGVFRATEGLFAEFGPHRIIDSPLSELSIVAVGMGMALNGLHPICEIQFADFIHPAFNQIVNEVAKMRYRSNGQYCVPMIIRAPWGGGISGGLYHSQSVEAVFAHTPGLYVLAPSTPYDMKGLFLSALRAQDPVLFLEHKKAYRLIKAEVPDEDYVVPIGVADVKRRGDDMTIVAYGMMLHESLKAADTLAGEGISVEVVDPRTLAPLDKGTILESVKKTGKALVVHEDNLTGGYGAEISAIIAQEAFEYLDGPVTRLCGPDIPAVPFSHPFQDFFLPNAAKIAAAARKLAAY